MIWSNFDTYTPHYPSFAGDRCDGRRTAWPHLPPARPLHQEVRRRKAAQMSYAPLTEEQIPVAVRKLNAIMLQLAHGKSLEVPGEPYPIAMGADGTVGWKWSQDRITGSFEIVHLLQIAFHLNIVLPDIRRSLHDLR